MKDERNTIFDIDAHLYFIKNHSPLTLKDHVQKQWFEYFQNILKLRVQISGVKMRSRLDDRKCWFIPILPFRPLSLNYINCKANPSPKPLMGEMGKDEMGRHRKCCHLLIFWLTKPVIPGVGQGINLVEHYWSFLRTGGTVSVDLVYTGSRSQRVNQFIAASRECYHGYHSKSRYNLTSSSLTADGVSTPNL
jgi:hypothetical protein